MWQGISNQLSEQLGYSFKITEKEVLTGSEVNQCYCISDGNERFFLKLNTRDNLVIFETEAESLRILNEACCVQVPQFVHMGTCKDKAFLVLNYLPTKPLDSHSAYELGQNLASQHLWGEQIEYGFDFDNYIGLTPQPNKWRRKWCRFFAEQRIAWQLQLCEEKDISFGNIDTITSNVIQCLLNHQPKPSLLHGDLCYANSALTVSGPIIFDPATYWGDRECDIATAELFAQFPPEFYQGYNSIYPLDENYGQRKELYQLYYLLNQSYLFGDCYIEKARQIINKLKLAD
ncbi:fructosamine kinase family protein [Photobacterium damselae]|uniref:fructosamine kinase family protein n=1 Tax=Photobacterium damselae TaxID=38293 RepID=UPI001EFD7EDA|nr:fructosamine kinase family protein [Photobacterium damselae]MCG9777297.1 fructosamine kinase family protein [Photobacterium damselae]